MYDILIAIIPRWWYSLSQNNFQSDRHSIQSQRIYNAYKELYYYIQFYQSLKRKNNFSNHNTAVA